MTEHHNTTVDAIRSIVSYVAALLGIGTFAAIGKELRDMRGFGTPELLDALATVAGGVARTVMKMATNNTVQIGSANYSGFNGNFALGTWNFTTPNITTPHFVNAGGSSGWQNPVRFGPYSLWVDSAGKLRIKSSAPTSDGDGTVVGTQT